MAAENAAPEQPRLVEELKKMEKEYEPLLSVEKRLIGYTLTGGVVLLIVLVVISRVFL
jgi:hypothetical protein